ncbi:MAG: Ulp1 family isopeptidase [Legionellaceae bacterium]|nr:Ulp1 family isopeptidase [Legionellaceae bacterium]
MQTTVNTAAFHFDNRVANLNYWYTEAQMNDVGIHWQNTAACRLYVPPTRRGAHTDFQESLLPDILEFPFHVMLPINLGGGHWTSLAMRLEETTEKHSDKKIISAHFGYADSMSVSKKLPSAVNTEIQRINAVLQEKWPDSLKSEHCTKKVYTEAWQQSDGSSCGPYSLENARRFLAEKKAEPNPGREAIRSEQLSHMRTTTAIHGCSSSLFFQEIIKELCHSGVFTSECIKALLSFPDEEDERIKTLKEYGLFTKIPEILQSIADTRGIAFDAINKFYRCETSSLPATHAAEVSYNFRPQLVYDIQLTLLSLPQSSVSQKTPKTVSHPIENKSTLAPQTEKKEVPPTTPEKQAPIAVTPAAKSSLPPAPSSVKKALVSAPPSSLFILDATSKSATYSSFQKAIDIITKTIQEKTTDITHLPQVLSKIYTGDIEGAICFLTTDPYEKNISDGCLKAIYDIDRSTRDAKRPKDYQQWNAIGENTQKFIDTLEITPHICEALATKAKNYSEEMKTLLSQPEQETIQKKLTEITNDLQLVSAAYNRKRPILGKLYSIIDKLSIILEFLTRGYWKSTAHKVKTLEEKIKDAIQQNSTKIKDVFATEKKLLTSMKKQIQEYQEAFSFLSPQGFFQKNKMIAPTAVVTQKPPTLT